jgi:predicted nucleic acid-binding Zn ribbon protein
MMHAENLCKVVPSTWDGIACPVCGGAIEQKEKLVLNLFQDKDNGG